MPIGDDDYVDPTAVSIDLHFTLAMSERLAEAALPALTMLVADIVGPEATPDDLPGLIGVLFDLSIDPLAQLRGLSDALNEDDDDFSTFNLRQPGAAANAWDVWCGYGGSAATPGFDPATHPRGTP